MNYNKCIIIGNLTKEVETKYLPSGTPVTNFSIAVNRKYKQGEENKEEVSFFDVVTFGKQGELCKQYLHKGSSVLVEGRLHQRRWETEGQKRSKIEIVAENVRFMSSPKQGAAQQPADQSGEVEVPF